MPVHVYVYVYVYVYVCVHVHVHVHVRVVWLSVICFNVEIRSTAIFASSLVFFVLITCRQRHDIDIRKHMQALLSFPVICLKGAGKRWAALSVMFTVRSPAERVHMARF